MPRMTRVRLTSGEGPDVVAVAEEERLGAQRLKPLMNGLGGDDIPRHRRCCYRCRGTAPYSCSAPPSLLNQGGARGGPDSAGPADHGPLC